MAKLFANRAQFILGGAPSSTFAVGQDELLSIFSQYTLIQQPINGLNYTPSDIGVIPNTKRISLVFEYAFTNDALPFDFSSLPTGIVNLQCLLFSETNQPICILSNVFFKSDGLSYPDASIHAKRSVVFGALDINYFGT